jgi:hypothetical protein
MPPITNKIVSPIINMAIMAHDDPNSVLLVPG